MSITRRIFAGWAAAIGFPLVGDAVAQPTGTNTANTLFPIRTVANLPAATTTGLMYFVSDANATTFASVVAGGGGTTIVVYSDGTNWRIG